MGLFGNLLGDAGDVERLARLFEFKATELDSLGRQIELRLARAQWSCARADRARATAMGRRHEATREANRMREIAHTLRQLAAALRNPIVDAIN